MKCSKRITNFIVLGWLLAIIALFFYSFTQIDLGLTLTRASFWQPIQKNFQFIGYFKRPLSTGFYLGVLFLLFTFYFLILRRVKHGWLKGKRFWLLIFATTGILWFSYNAFSYDLFNYIFDAKIVAFYHQSPYKVKPLDFLNDPMLGFMHWTHRTSVYPPLWIGLSVIPFVLGFGKLILQLLSFKAMMIGFYLGTLWLIGKISAIMAPKQKVFNLAFYAFSPLVIIESLVSAHNDGMMMFFALLGFYFLLKKKPYHSLLALFFSIGIKYATVILLPVFALALWQKTRVKKLDYQKLNIINILAMSLMICIISYQIGFQPWYLLWILPFIALRANGKFFPWLTIGFSLGSLLCYAPFLYYGHWNSPVPTIKLWLAGGGLALGLLIVFLKNTKMKIYKQAV